MSTTASTFCSRPASRARSRGGGWNIGNAVQLGTAAGGAVSSSTNSVLRRRLAAAAVQLQGRQPVSEPLQAQRLVSAARGTTSRSRPCSRTIPGRTTRPTSAIRPRQIQPSLGRPLSGGTRTVTIEVAEPFTQFGPRITQFDVRASKIVRLPGSRRLQFNFDLYNALNGNSRHQLLQHLQPGRRRRPVAQPTQILDGRLAKFSVQFDF